PVVIGAGLDRDTTVRFPTTAIGRGPEPLDDRTDSQTRLGGLDTGGENQKKNPILCID
ncbi:hypothetical protein A2U01_0104451, partial [Trifolium medium]|nr:hypothetical protein [Trifolium medium]